MKNIFRRNLFGLLVGLAGGLSFAITTWGVDAVGLANSHAAYPWLKFIPGLLLSLLIGGLAGWLTVKVENAIFGIFFWLAAGLLLSILVVVLPLRFYPATLLWLEPSLQKFLAFRSYGNETTYVGIIFGVCTIGTLIVGALENTLVEHATFSTASGAIVTAMLAFALVFGVLGFVADFSINAQLRRPLQVMDETIQFAVDNQNIQVDRATARSMYLGSVSQIQEMLNRPRRLFIRRYSETLDQVDILVDFDGQYADCAVMSEHPSTCWPKTP